MFSNTPADASEIARIAVMRIGACRRGSFAITFHHAAKSATSSAVMPNTRAVVESSVPATISWNHPRAK
jgi:hypothetical protein